MTNATEKVYYGRAKALLIMVQDLGPRLLEHSITQLIKTFREYNLIFGPMFSLV